MDWQMWLSEMRSGMAYEGKAGERVLLLANALEALAGMVEPQGYRVPSDYNPFGIAATETPAERDARISAVIAKAIGAKERDGNG
jgi:hypothetical protein